jgi:hypothetical protein
MIRSPRLGKVLPTGLTAVTLGFLVAAIGVGTNGLPTAGPVLTVPLKSSRDAPDVRTPAAHSHPALRRSARVHKNATRHRLTPSAIPVPPVASAAAAPQTTPAVAPPVSSPQSTPAPAATAPPATKAPTAQVPPPPAHTAPAPKPQTAPAPAPPTTFDQRGTDPGAGTQTVPFDDSGSGPNPSSP